ncbi:heterokaryon incompatibility protein-domain-containing protein [Xylariaceae sp. FL1651]|nr:heterokaryon incompatibility protein-domain-containing protein [Xylariaceae sp. FL1651]
MATINPLGQPLTDDANMREIRLIKIMEDHDTLVCKLKHFRIHQAPLFRALSYTWKSPFDTGDDDGNSVYDQPEEIIIENKPMVIGRNLANALRALRDWHDGHDKYVWVDAICIDQANHKERAYQVSIMGDIFGSADDVVIWLGEEAQNSNLAVNFIKQLARCNRQHEGRREKVLAIARDAKYRAHWTALDKLWKRRWWERAWVLQETVLARKADFCCGRTVVSLSDVFDHARLLRLAWAEIYYTLEQEYGISMKIPTYHTLDGIRRLRSARLEGIILPIMACHFRTMSSSVTDLRDAIFSKLGMALDGYIVTPSYTDPLDVVYTEFVQNHITKTQSLEVIHMDARPRTTRDIPSWVPDWACKFAAEALQREYGADPRIDFRRYCASGNTLPSTQFDLSDPTRKVLSCKGHALDIVDGVSRAEDKSWSGVSAPRPAVQPKSGKCAYEDDAEIFEALWRSLTINQRVDGSLPGPEYGPVLADSFRAAMTRSASVAIFDHHCARISDFELFGKTVVQRMADVAARGGGQTISSAERNLLESGPGEGLTFRRLLTTQNGRAGTASCDVEPGDVVAILLGCSVPMVLRPLASGAYQVFGEAYIHGVMYGEAMDELMARTPEPEIFRLI